jgi:hypothetical protein
VIRACRGRGNGAGGDNAVPASEPLSADNRSHKDIGAPRFVTVQPEAGDGLGISITVSTCICIFMKLVLSVRFHSLVVVSMKITDFWDMAL